MENAQINLKINFLSIVPRWSSIIPQFGKQCKLVQVYLFLGILLKRLSAKPARWGVAPIPQNITFRSWLRSKLLWYVKWSAAAKMEIVRDEDDALCDVIGEAYVERHIKQKIHHMQKTRNRCCLNLDLAFHDRIIYTKVRCLATLWQQKIR